MSALCGLHEKMYDANRIVVNAFSPFRGDPYQVHYTFLNTLRYCSPGSIGGRTHIVVPDQQYLVDGRVLYV